MSEQEFGELFTSGFNNSAMHCSNTCQALDFDISDLLFATVLT